MTSRMSGTSILAGLIADKGGEQQIGTAERILAEIISSDVSLLVTVNQAIEGVLRNNQKRDKTPRRWRNWTDTNGRWWARRQRIFRDLVWKELPKSRVSKKSLTRWVSTLRTATATIRM